MRSHSCRHCRAVIPSCRPDRDGTGARVTEFGLDLSALALDMTNVATFLDSANDKAPIAQRGHAKQKRNDLRLVGLGLVVTRDGAIPVGDAVGEPGSPERVGITLGPQYGTVDADLVQQAAKEAVRGAGARSAACWFLDTDYDEESFFVRHAYFAGADEPYAKLQRALRAEVDEEAWASLYRTRSGPFPLPSKGKIAVKVVNHYGDEVLQPPGLRHTVESSRGVPP